jgi:hypothetical protein
MLAFAAVKEVKSIFRKPRRRCNTGADGSIGTGRTIALEKGAGGRRAAILTAEELPMRSLSKIFSPI